MKNFKYGVFIGCLLMSSCEKSEKTDGSAENNLSKKEMSAENAIFTKKEKSEVPAAPKSGETYLVKYKSTGAKGNEIWMTGLVTFPENYEQNKAGTHIISWAHGTTGISRNAAPSLFQKGGANEEALLMVAGYLDNWVQKGFIVVQPDYEGLGSEDSKGTYLNRQSLSNAVNDLVKTVKSQHQTSGKWVNIGWSQGGYAAISAADNAAEGLVGTISIAPGDSEIVMPELKAKGLKPEDILRMIEGDNLGFIPILLGGAINANDAVKADDFLSEKGKEMIQSADKMGLTELRKSYSQLSGKDMLKENPNTKQLQDYMDSQRLELAEPKGDVLVILGTEDVTVTGDTVRRLAENWKKRGLSVDFKEIKSADHRQSVPQSFDVQWDFVQKVLK